MPSDSCISQLHEIQSSSYHKPLTDVRATFLKKLKAFGKVCHQGVSFKLKPYGVEGNSLRFLKKYLDNREQRVILDGQCPSL